MLQINKKNYPLLAYQVNDFRFKFYRESDNIDAFLPFENIIKSINKANYLFDRKFTKKDIPELVEYLNTDTLYFQDDVFTTKGMSRKKYEPYKTIFETSGKIIVENDLREFFVENDFNVNSTQGIIDTIDDYAKQGMLHGFVGNSCPSLYLSKKHGEILIGVDYDEDTDDDILPDDSYKDLANICTDLWWYSIVDLEEFKKNNPEVDTSQFNVVDIPAGKWQLIHKYGISESGYHENLPYATLNKIK